MGFSFLNKQEESKKEEKEKLFDYRETEEYKTFINVLGKRFEIYCRQLDRDVTRKIDDFISEFKNKIVELSFPPKNFNQYKIDFNPEKHIIFGKITLPLIKIVFKKDIVYDLYDEELEDEEILKRMKERWNKIFDFIIEIANPIREEIFRDKEYNFKFGKAEKITGAKKYHLWTTSVSFSFEIPVPEDYDPKKVVQIQDETKGTEGIFKELDILGKNKLDDKEINIVSKLISNDIERIVNIIKNKKLISKSINECKHLIKEKKIKDIYYDDGLSVNFYSFDDVKNEIKSNKKRFYNHSQNLVIISTEIIKNEPELDDDKYEPNETVENTWEKPKVAKEISKIFESNFSILKSKYLDIEIYMNPLGWDHDDTVKEGGDGYGRSYLDIYFKNMNLKQLLLDIKGKEDFMSTEEKKLVMNKTIYTSTDPSDETVKVDHLDKNQDLEKDAVKVMKSERDITATYPLPLFRFEEKQKPQVVEWCKNVIMTAASIMKEESATYVPLVNYIKIPEEKDIAYLIDLTINRNKELFTSCPKEMEIELVTCFYDKKIRTFLKIPEDELINKSVHPEYFEKVSNIRSSFKQFFEALKEKLDLKDTGINKDIEFYVDDSSGSEDYGAGISIFMKYTKPIDYANQKRGKESYGPLFDLFDEEFKQSIEEQNSINLEISTEAIADGMGEGSDDKSDDNQEEESENDPSNELDDSGDDDMDMGTNDGEDGSENTGEDNSSSDSDEKSDMPEPPKQSGANPFADINSRERITNELQELKSEVDKALVKLEPFKRSVLVSKMQELSGFIEDALKNTYIVKVEDSLIRYNLYVTQFEDLVKALKRSFEKQAASKIRKAK